MQEINKNLCKVRTVTTFVSLSRDRSSWNEVIQQASDCCQQISDVLLNKQYCVQSIRIVTNPFGEYIRTQKIEDAREDLGYLRALLQSINADSELRLRFAIGEARTLDEMQLLPELIAEFGDLCNACVNIAMDENSILDNTMITASAGIVKRISEITPQGEGNFNFTVNFNCQPLIPYFPASYHQKELGRQVVIGLETPDLLVHELSNLNQRFSASSAFDDQETLPKNHNSYYSECYSVMHSALQYVIDDVSTIVSDMTLPHQFQFAGFDSSAAPSKDCASMTDVYQQLGVEYFGASGTVEASALLTRVFKSIQGVSLVGFSGLMLALTEDRGLAAGSINGDFDIRSLLTYSAVCGIGLDTVPVPGDITVEKLSALMRDTGTMAYRLNKPLTVRVFPVPGLQAGNITTFESEDLCNCAVLAVP
ncbi:DUF711 family protein [Eionea flava]